MHLFDSVMKVIVFFAVLIFLCSGVFAFSGVNPRSYEIDFEPGYKGEFGFNFFIDGNVKADLSVQGDLAEYVSLDKEKISGSERVVALLRLPSDIDSPGVNQIKIVAGDVIGVIKVNVPYPEKYIELELSAPNINVGEIVDVDLSIFNRGIDFVVAGPRIEIYKKVTKGSIWKIGDEEKKEIVETIEIESVEIAVGESKKFNISLETLNYSAGDYFAVALVNYGEKVARIENLFRVGEPSVRILNYTREFRENKVERFEIEIESLSNSDMDGLYAEVNIIGFENASFVSSDVKLGAWKSATLVGFLDTAEILGYKVEAEIILHCGGEAGSPRVVELKILKGFDYVFFGVVLGCLAVFGFLIWRGMVFVGKLRKHKAKS